jgi:hypothetical protein
MYEKIAFFSYMEGSLAFRGMNWLAACVAAVALSTSAMAETPEEWVKLGARVHGGFGAFIPVGIKIGLDAAQTLKA